MAMAGVPPHLHSEVTGQSTTHGSRVIRNSRSLEHIRNEPGFGCMVERCNRELELLRELGTGMSRATAVPYSIAYTHPDDGI